MGAQHLSWLQTLEFEKARASCRMQQMATDKLMNMEYVRSIHHSTCCLQNSQPVLVVQSANATTEKSIIASVAIRHFDNKFLSCLQDQDAL